MAVDTRRQLTTFAVLLAVYALLAMMTYLVVPLDQLVPAQQVPAPKISIPQWQLGLASAGLILVVYGLLGLAGYWFARRLELPPIYREGAGWRAWLLWPMLIGLGVGVILVIVDQLFATAGAGEGFSHPGFPFSLIASAAAGIGEEIMFRGFMMGLWAFLLNLLLRRWGGTRAALWLGNIIAALAFSAGHLPSAMFLLDVTTPADLPMPVLVEGLLLNSFLGLVAGERYMRDGLVAAIGVHFWADIIWHVVWPLLGLSV
ncbi:MAG: CPBP family intramembrane metalloprotease [Anaerolineae bacterium]|nr:CPBP family intramembrane metalloprotease [Anaerolineae bacterium]